MTEKKRIYEIVSTPQFNSGLCVSDESPKCVEDDDRESNPMKLVVV